MIVERIKGLCRKEKISLAQLEKELHFGNGTIRRWNDNLPSVARLLTVSQRFGVDINYLIGTDSKKRK